MRSFASGLLAILMFAPAALAAERAARPSVRVRLDDYASVTTRQMARAQREVTRWYAAVGVETRWLRTRRRATFSAPSAPADLEVPDLTVIVLSQSMTARMAPPENALGLAAHAGTGRGRIAYVFYERLRASTQPCDDARQVLALSLVIAHEIGHLLLPYGSDSAVGIMRGHWDLEAFRHVDARDIGFTPSQGRYMRRLLNRR